VTSRRSSQEVRALMLHAAQKLFQKNGFETTSTRDISAAAGVSESMIFRHFGSKKALFEEAVLAPFSDFVRSFVSNWTAAPGATGQPEQLAHSYVSGLFELCRDHLDLIATMSARQVSPAAQSDTTGRLLVEEQLDALADQLGRYHAQMGSHANMDAHLAVRFAIAMIVGAAQLGEDFFGIGDRLTTELAAFVVRGAGSDPAND
jgi:AcrR family transcriptional regulator